MFDVKRSSLRVLTCFVGEGLHLEASSERAKEETSSRQGSGTPMDRQPLQGEARSRSSKSTRPNATIPRGRSTKRYANVVSFVTPSFLLSSLHSVSNQTTCNIYSPATPLLLFFSLLLFVCRLARPKSAAIRIIIKLEMWLIPKKLTTDNQILQKKKNETKRRRAIKLTDN